MRGTSPSLDVIVLGDPQTPIGSFVEKNLRAANITGHFVESTEAFVKLESQVDASRLIVIDSDWEWMLLMDKPQARLLLVHAPGDHWTPSWTEPAKFEVRSTYLDGELFQRHVFELLREG